MRKFLTLIIAVVGLVTVAISVPSSVEARVSVRGYYKSNGTYVQPHYRTSPDGYKSNNWSYKGNVNPYSGRVGTRY
jgi:hypothetical protein